tara:strand:+ start:59 stop:235 length:177 start_codon:yes stop_codon:yes gene_type:complete
VVAFTGSPIVKVKIQLFTLQSILFLGVLNSHNHGEPFEQECLGVIYYQGPEGVLAIYY